MAILEKEVEVGLDGKTVKHYEALGYDIPIYRDDRGHFRHVKILVKVEDLTKGSNVKLTKVCDDCKEKIPEQSYSTILRSRGRDGKDRCRKCGRFASWSVRKDNIPYEKSLEYYVKTNGLEYLLTYFSENNPKTPKDISFGTSDDYFWNCPQCGNEKKLRISNLVRQGFSCQKCSDGVSYPEKFVFNFLEQLKEQLTIDFEYQKTFDWSKNIAHTNPKLRGKKIYDFHIPSRKMIIESHGEQHFKQGTRKGAKVKTLKEEQENDQIKEALAIENGIEIYVSLDCRESTMEYIKNSILSSRLASLFDLEHIDWLKCHEAAYKSLVIRAGDMYSQGKRAVEIAEIMKLSDTTIRSYLTQGGYDLIHPKEIVQLTLDGNFMKYWDRMIEAANENGILYVGISSCCRGIRDTAGGFKWMYKDDYEANNCIPIFYERENKLKKSVVKLDLNGNFINEYSSLTEAANEIGKSHDSISACCIGRQKTAHGFKWMYKGDYEENGYTRILNEVKYIGKRNIVKLDLNGNFINEYSSLTEAAKELGKGTSNISECCSGKIRKAYGFIWMYKEDYEGSLE
ncbi:NUMOD1 domain-containing DNA-binding protein [Bacillaceae bacterium C204]|uniref:NUMOD1 domain-containing DNA-binding protein n=1 Tax=Neobacillus sp. 204 TaxID=3383351 RepID=UPI00397E0936